MNEPQVAPPVDEPEVPDVHEPDVPDVHSPALDPAAPPAAKPTVVNERRDPCGCVFFNWSNGGKNVEPCLAHGLGSMHDAMQNVLVALAEFTRLIDVTAQIELKRLKNRPTLSVVRGAAAEHVLGRRS